MALCGHAVGAAVLRTAVKESRCISGCDSVVNQSRMPEGSSTEVLDVSVKCYVAAVITLTAKQTARRRPCDGHCNRYVEHQALSAAAVPYTGCSHNDK
jgi:hypothetical protein